MSDVKRYRVFRCIGWESPHIVTESPNGEEMVDAATYDALARRLAKVASGMCLKCNMGPMRESCAYPEACEHPGRELAYALNRTLLDRAEVGAALEECLASKALVTARRPCESTG